MDVTKPISKLLQAGTIMQQGYGGDVPEGHFVVCVGENRSRHLVPISCLSHPEFQALRGKSEEEFGFKQEMGLTIPCN
ncbi:hypothetical protein ACOSQ2_022960 [Xanthoceras sorbifolium]